LRARRGRRAWELTGGKEQRLANGGQAPGGLTDGDKLVKRGARGQVEPEGETLFGTRGDRLDSQKLGREFHVSSFKFHVSCFKFQVGKQKNKATADYADGRG